MSFENYIIFTAMFEQSTRNLSGFEHKDFYILPSTSKFWTGLVFTPQVKGVNSNPTIKVMLNFTRDDGIPLKGGNFA